MTEEQPHFVSTASHAEAAKFHLGFMAMMLASGREEEATKAFQDAHQQLDLIIANETVKNEALG